MKYVVGSDGSIAQLTPREIECMSALADGLKTEGIAKQLAISIPTVSMHLANARHKLHAATREQAVAIAIRNGLLK